jgi:hypothetical protein
MSDTLELIPYRLSELLDEPAIQNAVAGDLLVMGDDGDWANLAAGAAGKVLTPR